MVKSLTILVILAIIGITTPLNKGKKFIYDIETTFDKDNNEFTFEYNGDDESTFYLLIIRSNSTLVYKYGCVNLYEGRSIASGSYAYGINVQKGSCSITIDSYEGSEIKGTIMVHPLNIEINVDFNKKEKYEFDGLTSALEKFPPLVYSFSNSEEDVLVKFNYKRDEIGFDNKLFALENPFKVCLKDDCKDKIETYKFLKGNKYKIYLMFQELKSDFFSKYYIPIYSFEKVTEVSENNKDDKNDRKRLRGVK